jgi:peptide/nickel transport system permease protein
MVLGAGFFAPYAFALQNREATFVKPTRLHFLDARGQFHFRPFVYGCLDGTAACENGVRRAFRIHFFVHDPPDRRTGDSFSWHLFGVERPGQIFLMGTDGLGRDQFSRFLYGGRISLLAGWLAAAIALSIGASLGTIAGFYGKAFDQLLMRGGELFLALPWLYLLFAVRAFLPLQLSATRAFLLVIAVVGFVGWARPARLVRGVVFSAKQRNYVVAARGFGASEIYLLRRHILPQVFGLLLTQAALLVPQFILAEVTLSFLGLGVGEPAPSWGNLLASLQQYHVLTSYWWMYLPPVALILLFFGYQLLADMLRERTAVVVV